MRCGALAGAIVWLLASCSGNADPNPGTVDLVGVWNASISEISAFTITGQPVKCTAAWVMSISAQDAGSDRFVSTIIPLSATADCGPGPEPWRERGNTYEIRQFSDSIAFLTASRADTFLVAEVIGNTVLSGRTAGDNYPGAQFNATRRTSSVDPNLSPYLIEVGRSFPEVEVADSVIVQARVFDGYGQELAGATVAWTSSAPSVASIGSDGIVHGLTPGHTTVTGKSSGIEGTVEIEVLSPPASITITQLPDSLIDPTAWVLIAVARDAGGNVLSGRRFHWSTSDPAVATVAEYAETGEVTTTGPGSATITARSAAVEATTVLTVLPAVKEIVVSGTGTSVPIGGTVQLTATTRDIKGNTLTGRPVAWEAGPPDFVSVDANGLVTVQRGGPMTVTVRAEQVTRTLDLLATMDGPLTAVAAGGGHTCGLTSAGTTYCWGHAEDGRLGPNQTVLRSTAVLIPTGQGFISLAAGRLHTCGLNQAGAAFCWGANGSGQLGQASVQTGEIVAVAGGLTFTKLAAGGEYTCGLRAAQDAYCWGNDFIGQLGRGVSDAMTHASPALVAGGHHFTDVVAGDDHACGLTTAGEAYCWGSNLFGILGLGAADNQPHPLPVHAASGLTFTALAAGTRHTCGISTDGSVYCWGDGQLTPTQRDASTGWVKLGVGLDHFCRLDGTGNLSCWAVTSAFDLDYSPTQPITDFSVGAVHNCALPAIGKAVCWGLNDGWQLGAVEATSVLVEVAGQP